MWHTLQLNTDTRDRIREIKLNRHKKATKKETIESLLPFLYYKNKKIKNKKKRNKSLLCCAVFVALPTSTLSYIHSIFTLVVKQATDDNEL